MTAKYSDITRKYSDVTANYLDVTVKYWNMTAKFLNITAIFSELTRNYWDYFANYSNNSAHCCVFVQKQKHPRIAAKLHSPNRKPFFGHFVRFCMIRANSRTFFIRKN
ncbi:MAG TPA: hypothetical protein PKY59_15410 [Pyrinomonadaceae bacterium]|nr:hypothetical protein [Pyrinomonadaceae bacterium]